jgi:hypothetical protein
MADFDAVTAEEHQGRYAVTATLLTLLGITTFSCLQSFVLGRRYVRLLRENTTLRALLKQHCEEGDGISRADTAAQVMASLIDVTGPVAAAADFARRQRETEGWSPAAAEQMGMMIYMVGVAKVAGRAMSAHWAERDAGDDSDTASASA